MPRKVGLLGAGYIIDSHAKALAATDGVELWAVCDTSRARAERAAQRYGAREVFGSLDELARSACEVVHVLLPPPLHLPAAHTLVAAGKSVFLEKPMGLDSAACAALAQAAQARGVTVGVNHNFLFSRGYEALRASARAGELGRIDRIAVNWHFALPLLQAGPFDSWPVVAPANLIFELGSHLACFIVDLVGAATVISAQAARPLRLPDGRTVYRHWTALLQQGGTSIQLSISLTPGHADRSLYLRGRAGSAQLDFGRDILSRQSISHDNPIFDAYASAHTVGRMLARQARRDIVRRLRAALAKSPDANPFEESIVRSIRSFYATRGAADPRHDAGFGAEVIRVCEDIARTAGVGQPSTEPLAVRLPQLSTAARVLVVGGTGFIGRRLVRALVDRGLGVRLLTRNANAAAVELGNLPVELRAGSHGDKECLRSALEGIDTVYHLAKCEGKRWADYVEDDITPTRVLAEASIAAGVRRFIYTGTIASYDWANPQGRVDGRTPVDPRIARRDHYARSKAACEALLQQLHRESRLPLVILRPGIVLGPGSPPAHPGVAYFSGEALVQYWGDGRTPLPLVWVDDVADALVRAMEVPDIEGQAFLLTSPPLLTAREYVTVLAEHMGSRIEARPRSAWRYWAADMTKELAKNAVHHPNRRWPSLHDWRCHAHAAHFDAQLTTQILGWQPVADRATLIQRGIAEPVEWFSR